MRYSVAQSSLAVVHEVLTRRIAWGLENELDPHLDAILRILWKMERMLLTIRKI